MLFCSAVQYIASYNETRLLLFLFDFYQRIFVDLVKTCDFNVARFNRKLIQNGEQNIMPAKSLYVFQGNVYGVAVRK